MTHRALAVDLGAGSGRVILGTLHEGRLTLEEVHRFPNEPVTVHGRLSWDILALYREILKGLRVGAERAGVAALTVGIDTWGVDYGLIDARGQLLQNPVCYRDSRTSGLIEESLRLAGSGTLFRATGIPDLFFNTSLQLMALARDEAELIPLVHRLLFTPDLLGYFLTGVARAERTIAGTSQLLEAGARGQWSEPTFKTLDLEDWLPKMAPLIEPGTVLGRITGEVAATAGLPSDLTVVAVCSHDTESSLLAMPSHHEGAVFLNVGSWAIMGLEVDKPVLDETFRLEGFSNEVGFGGKVCLLKNIMGLWLAQESKLTWERQSGPLDWADLYREAAACPAFKVWVDPDDELFVAPGDLPARIRAYSQKTGQENPTTRGAVLRCVLESLAFRFRQTWERLQALSGRRLNRIHLMGGGSKGALLCQFTANACGQTVEAGPEEASATGNLLAQFQATGALASIAEARALVGHSFPTRVYQPQEDWTDAYQHFLTIIRSPDP